jgi:hypothetical protein
MCGVFVVVISSFEMCSLIAGLELPWQSQS